MRIGIDCRLAGLQHAGIGRYIENLVTRLLDTEQSTNWVLFFYDEPQARAVLGKRFGAHSAEIIYAPIKHYTLSEQLALPKIFHAAKLDLLHVPHFNVPLLYFKKVIVTIHDLLWHEQRGSSVTTLSPLIYWLKYGFYHIVTWSAVVRSKAIVVPTQTVRKTLVTLYPSTEGKIVVTLEGARSLLLSKSEASAAEHHASKVPGNIPYLLYVGSLYPHKNVSIIIRSMKKMPDISLKIVGSRSVFQDSIAKEVRAAGLEDRVAFLGFQSDEKLAQLYAGALALVQPSLSEGFGLTGVEALAIGTPVIASDIPVFREIYQDAVIFFDPLSEVSFVTAVRRISKQQTRDTLSKKGKLLSKQYSWDTMTAETAKVYERIVSSA